MVIIGVRCICVHCSKLILIRRLNMFKPIELIAAVFILVIVWVSPAAAERPGVGSAVMNATRNVSSQISGGIAGRPGVNPNRQSTVQMQSPRPSIGGGPRAGSRPSSNHSSHSTRYGIGFGVGRSNRHYGSNYGSYNNSRYGYNYNRYGGRRYSNAGAYFAGGLLLGSWIGSYNRGYRNSYNRYDPYYSGGFSYGRYYSNEPYYSSRYPRTSSRYYRSTPVEPTIVYREKIVSDGVAREDHEPHLLKDMEGNCFEVSYSNGGQELRLQVPEEQCEW
jgi:hypothetical protein